MIVGEGIVKSFGGLVALDGIDFRVDPGEIVGVIGPNGAGKTTLFNTITGVLAPDEGSIRHRDRELVGRKPHEITRLGIARTFQTVRVFDTLSVLENVLVGARFGGGVDTETGLERCERYLAFVGLEGRGDEPASELTIAEQKRVELARVLAVDPDVVLLDEIAAGLTPMEIERMSDTIEAIRDELEVSVFWIEHIMDAIMGTTDRIIVLSQGQKIADGPPAEIRTDDAVSAAYLGDSL